MYNTKKSNFFWASIYGKLWKNSIQMVSSFKHRVQKSVKGELDFGLSFAIKRDGLLKTIIWSILYIHYYGKITDLG